MKFLSVCSGIEAASVAWAPLGWEAVGFSDIDPFSRAFLAHRFPHIPNFGDMTKYAEWKPEPFDLLCGGTPCQAFSVAGLRQGLEDRRGNLTLVFLELLERFQSRWFMWENVPGVLSDERAFGAFLSRISKLGYGWAYRVLDAAYYGLAAPRPRVFLVGHRGGAFAKPAAVLFDEGSVCYDFAPRKKARMEGARTLSGNPPGANQRAPIIPCWWDGTQRAQCADAVLCKRQTMPERRRMPALIDESSKCRWATPREWERLMGFPDDWTLIPYRGKPAADSPRYKAIGNSWAVPVARWIGERIAFVDSL